MDPPTKRCYRADWVLPISAPPIRDGVVVVENQKIVHVGPFDSRLPAEQVIHLRSSVIIPGLVNAHTHLEFSHLENPLGHSGLAFTEWIRKIVGIRMATSIEDKRTAIRRGLLESFAAGVWCIGDIATDPIEIDAYRLRSSGDTVPSETVLFHEQLGRSSELFDEKLDQVDQFLHLSECSPINAAISPHAPYSVHPRLLERLCELAKKHSVPVAMHLAETREELELLSTQTGPFVDLLKDFGVWDRATFQPVQTIRDILEVLSQTPRSLVIHANYLTEDELDLIRANRQNMSVVYCPRTHHYFGHEPYPLKQMLGKSIRVVLGTDSRASNPDLNLFAEMKFVKKFHPAVSSLEIVRMATADAAASLGQADHFGSIEVGRQAALSQILLPGSVNLGEQNLDVALCESAICRPLAPPAGQ